MRLIRTASCCSHKQPMVHALCHVVGYHKGRRAAPRAPPQQARQGPHLAVQRMDSSACRNSMQTNTNLAVQADWVGRCRKGLSKKLMGWCMPG